HNLKVVGSNPTPATKLNVVISTGYGVFYVNNSNEYMKCGSKCLKARFITSSGSCEGAERGIVPSKILTTKPNLNAAELIA
ncbi:MAG: hypothetical protein ACJAYR_000995, partial [Sneathiella sp.]